MAKGLFTIGWTVEEILQLQRRAKEHLMQFKTVMQYSDGGNSASKNFTMDVADVLDECQYALSLLAPELGVQKTRYMVSDYRRMRNL